MLFLRKKASPTTDTVEIAMETKITLYHISF